MDWLNLTWITTYWLPLLIALLIGFILGWLLLGLPPRRKNAAYEAQIADIESRSRKADRELADARKQADQFKGTLATADSTANDLRGKLTAAEASLQKVTEERAGFEADVQSRNIEVADLKMQLALLQDQLDKTKAGVMADAEALRSGLDTRNAQLESIATERDSIVAERDNLATERERLAAELDKAIAERDQVQAELASVRSSGEQAMQSIASKDAALNEAYQRVVNFQRVLEERDATLAAAQAELTALRTDVASLNSMKAELEDRLQKVRGDVAGEMAVLTSTMVKLKEEQLATANARIAELMQELNAQKAGLQVSQAVG